MAGVFYPKRFIKEGSGSVITQLTPSGWNYALMGDDMSSAAGMRTVEGTVELKTVDEESPDFNEPMLVIVERLPKEALSENGNRQDQLKKYVTERLSKLDDSPQAATGRKFR